MVTYLLVIRDSSDSNLNFYDLTMARKTQSALYRENMDSPVPPGTARSLTFYIINNRVRPSSRYH